MLMIYFQIPKNIHDLITIPGRNTLVLYKDGTTESLQYCIDSRKHDKTAILPIVRPDEQLIQNVSKFVALDEAIWLSYFAKSIQSGQVEFVYFKLNVDTLVPSGHIFKFKLARTEQNATLIGFSVVEGDVHPNLFTICK